MNGVLILIGVITISISLLILKQSKGFKLKTSLGSTKNIRISPDSTFYFRMWGLATLSLGLSFLLGGLS